MNFGLNPSMVCTLTAIAACFSLAAGVVVPSFEAERAEVLARRTGWLEKAEAAKPRLFRRDVTPVGLVRPVEEASAFQGWRVEAAGDIESMCRNPLVDGDSFVIDFGEHLVGTLSFRLVDVRCVDAPIRLRFTFAEVPLELVEDSDVTMGSGWNRLSRAWIQKDTLTIDEVPSTNTLARRYAFRYVKVDVLGCALGSCRFDELHAVAETSADDAALKSWTAPSPTMARIDAVALRTLRDCMQTVFEDGPKRDRRLWLGDLKLEALANYATYRNFGVVKRSLYLLAGLADDNGYVHSDAYERPVPRIGGCLMFDYSALFAATVLEYLEASGDRETAEDLWPLCVRQLQLLLPMVGEDGIFRSDAKWGIDWFIDHNPSLNGQTAMQGVLVYGFKATLRLGRTLGREADVAFLEGIVRSMERGANEVLWDESRGLYVCEKDSQVSVHGQMWSVIGGIAKGERARRCLKAVMGDKAAVQLVSPYAHHYFVEALHEVGQHREADAHLAEYWGRMVELGADAFWEVFVPENHRSSPYGTPLLNSYCHAWGCTPVCFLRDGKHRRGNGMTAGNGNDLKTTNIPTRRTGK